MKTVKFKGFEAQAMPGVVLHGTSIRLEFQYNSRQERAKFLPLSNVKSQAEFEGVLREANGLLETIRGMILRGQFHDDLYANLLPKSSFAEKKGGANLISFSELAEKYIDSQKYAIARGDLSHNTLSTRARNLRGPHLQKLKHSNYSPLSKQGLANIRVADINYTILKHFQDHLYHEIPRKNVDGKQSGYSEKYVNNIIDAVKQVLKYAKKGGMIKENPALDIETLRVPPKNKVDDLVFFNIEQQDSVYDSCVKMNKPWLAEMFRFGCWTGLRKQELLALAWEDINLEKNSLVVRRAYTNEFHDPKTKSSVRSFVMLPEARRCLDRMIQWTHDEKPVDYSVKRKANNGYVTENLRLVFMNLARGQPNPRAWTYSAIRNAWDRHVKPASGVNIPLNHVRHSYATMMISNGVDILMVAHDMGHGDHTMLSRSYSEIRMEFNPDLMTMKWHAVKHLLEDA